MKRWLSLGVVAGVLSWVAALPFEGCSSSSTTSSGSACDDYFNALVRCTSFPADELARLRGRWEQVCAQGLAEPGTSASTSFLEACAQATDALSCGDRATPGACKDQPGSLGAGSACGSSAQCLSHRCEYSFPADGGSLPNCGTCAAAIAVGQPCGNSSAGGCASGAACDLSSSTPTCLAPTTGGAGAVCDGAVHICEQGLHCDGASSKCAPDGDVGAACAGSSECKSTLVCVGRACQNPGATGGACASDEDCATDLGCDASKKQCGALTYASAGAPCGGLVRCLVGSCNGATCPAVIADGQPCTSPNATATCDTFASCVAGACTLGSPACR